MFSKARSLLARLRSSRAPRQEEARFDGRMEELEPRILFSADAAGALGLVPDTELPPPLTCTLPASNTPPACASTAVTQREVAFVDASLPDAKELADLLQKQVDANRTLSIYWINANSDGVKQISDVLATLKDVDAVHILSHGSDGNLQLGNATLNAQTLSQYAGDLASWHKSLSQDADLMLYGCDLAQDASGQQVVNDIQLLTGANVAASTDLTGDSSQGGDWVLEYQLGQINTGVALDVWHQTDWHGLLATYTVTNTSDSGAGSLRAAITSANGNAGTDTINFNISSGTAGTGSDTGAYVITLASGLPTITEAVTIDASTQSGYVAGGLHTVVLDGNDAGAYGLQLSSASDGSTVRGLVIRNFTSYGIYTPAGSDNHTIVGNYIGSFYADGSNAGTGKGNATSGIFSQGANATIGGTTAADRNVISGNSGAYGIYLSTGADGTVIKGNYIGTNAAGTSVFSTTNPNYGIMVETSATNITIGGTATGEGNVVSGHTSRGMWITTTGTVTIQGNYVGTDYTGTVDLGNTGYGIYLDDTGSASIGGTTAGAGNLVSGNDGGGIFASNGSVTVQGNTIGLNAAGTAKLANTGVGLYLDTSNASTVGGNTAAARNIISGNSTYGIHVAPSAASSITIKGNYIGVGADGSTLLGNGSAGIYINNDYVTVGGKSAGDGNIIAGNGGAGIAVVTYDKNLFYRNSIYSNTGLGIDLGNDGVTANDYNDGDGGANWQNNYPVITSAVVNGSNTTITGSIDFYNHSTADTVYIELFSSPALDGTGYGEGKTYLGSATLTTDTTTGDATFSITVTGVSVGDYITAVANVETSYLGASEFSLGMAATSIANAPKGKLLWNDNDQTSQWVSNWTGSAFTPGGMTGLTLDDDVTMMAVAEAPTRDELIMIGSADVSGKIEAIVWNGSSWTAPLGIPVTSSTSASASQYNSFAVAYESQSGDAILVWDNGTTGTAGLSYAVWNGTSWSSTSTITAPSSGEPLSMKLASNPTADGMVLIATTNTGDNCYAIVWNGSSWGNSQSLGTSLGASKQYFEINAAYESQSGEAMVVYDSSTTNSSSLQYRTWNGTSWSSEGTIAAPSGITAGSDVYVTAIASDATSNRIAVAVKDAANEVYVSIWDGSSWGNAKAMTTSGIDTTDHHATMAVAFESLSGDLLCAYGKAAGPNVYYQTWSSGGGWSTEQTGPSMGATDITYSLKLYSDPYSNTIMMADQDGGLDLNMVAWDGSAWGTVTTVDSSTGEHYRENYAFAWNRYTPPSLSNITGDTLAYTEDASAAVIDQSTTATASDGDGIGYTDGNLTVSFTGGSTSTEDVLSIRNQGTGAGQIGVSGSDVTYAGTIIGTYTGGSSGAALVITLNSAASNAAVGALANNITYVNTNSTTPSTTSRTVRFVVTNARGLSSANYDNTITVSAVNDAPTATITPTTYSATEQTTLTLNGTGLTIADVDAGSSSVQATLSVVSGTLTVSAGTTGVTVGNSGTSSVTLTGTVTQINNLLAGSLSGTVSYIINSDAPPASDTLTLGIDDQGNTGSGGAKTGSDTATINITAVNDAPVITSNGGGASASVNTAENTSSVTTVTATDPDTGATQTYSITGGADAAKFSINSSTGVLTFVSAPDYESPTDAGGDNVYDVIVQVSDGSQTDTQAIAVTVTDVNDNAPVITSDGGGASATKNVAENGTAVTTVTSTDVDTGTTLTYSITGGADAAKFSINSSTGVLTFVSAPDYESPTDAGGNNVYDVTVQVSDGTNTDTQAIAVTVTDLNDNAPVITSDGGGASATKNVAENGTAVTTVTATDVDTGTTLTYSITGGADAAKFSINASTGVLTFVSAPDYESPTDAG
ncbi:MAG TPA: DUF4347 domain-containing protein, partial [Aquabacterium sp.]|uniref:DUF4347 domain-containing protein n=1 Tax=Aquabacterium sp. TaxID=1872578 RepID=UPI002E3713DA